jgi:hypothetical protein
MLYRNAAPRAGDRQRELSLAGGIGEAKDFPDGGKNIARDAVLPLNTHGGQLSHGRTHGMGLVQEAIIQLRGEGGPRQVPGARVAVVSSGGLTPSGVLLLRADS